MLLSPVVLGLETRASCLPTPWFFSQVFILRCANLHQNYLVAWHRDGECLRLLKRTGAGRGRGLVLENLSFHRYVVP